MRRTLPSVVLAGRPNVGKSTLFNRMTGSRRAIVAPVAGTTRDALARPVVWRDLTFELFDTGGMFGASEDPLHALVIEQGRRAVATADLAVLVVDARDGLVPGDRQIAEELRGAAKTVLLAINKTDVKEARAAAIEFFELGFDPVLEISAEHGTGVAELLDAIVTSLKGMGKGRRAEGRGQRAEGRGEGHEEGSAEDAEGSESLIPNPESRPEVTIAIVGRPNVGKSSIVNRLLQEERVLVSDLPGTTRDAIDAVVTWHRRHFRIVDTAGMRRPGRVSRGGKVELVSVAAAKKAIADADVVALVIDASSGATEQDAAIGGEADRAGRGIVIVANKWDLVKDRGENYASVFDDETRQRMRFLDYAPILHLSAATGERVPRLLATIDKIGEARRQRVPTPELNRFVEAITAQHPPVSPTRRHVRILYAAQIGVAPPRFVFFTNVASELHFSYERFLVNQLRERFGFAGTPIRVQVRRRAKKERAGARARSRRSP